jgi:flagellar protein FlaG
MNIEGIKLQISNILNAKDWPGKNANDESIDAKKPDKLGSSVQNDKSQSRQKIEKKPFSREDLKKIQDRINEAMAHLNYRIQFFIHEPTGRTVAKIVDRQTGEIIEQIPEEEFLEMASKIHEMADNLIDEHV